MAKSYFSHDSNAKDDPKIIKLIDALGLEGYGAFWVLIELLREQPNLRLPIASIPRICRTFGITTPKMESVIYHFELFSNDGEYFFSPSLLKRMLEMKEKYTARSLEGWKTRLQNTDNQQNLLEATLQCNAAIPQNDADAMQNDAKNANKIKVNKIKVNKIKVNKIKVKKKKEDKYPTIEEAESYFIEKGASKIESDKFFYFYESKGWKVGKNPMVNWKSAASGWLSRIGFVSPQVVKSKNNDLEAYEQRMKELNQPI